MPSFEAGFTAPASGGTYHSAYDDTFNMEHYLDPGYLGHAGRRASTASPRCASPTRDVLPFHYSDYAAAVVVLCDELQQVQAQTRARRRSTSTPRSMPRTRGGGRPRRLEARADELLAAGDPMRGRPRAINDALMRQERALTTARGLPGRPWFRHQIYAPGLVTGYAVQYLPGMRDAVEHGDGQTARTYRDRLLQSLQEAAQLAERGQGD